MDQPVNSDDAEEFININEIIKRDTQKNKDIQKLTHRTYQVQSEKNSKNIKLFYLGKFETTPIKNILSFFHPKHLECKCDLMSYLITKEEINSEINNPKQYFKLIGFVICIEDYVIASLDLVYQPKKNVVIKNANISKQHPLIDIIDGTFKVVLFYKQRSEYKETIIREYTEYSGREESIYILTSILVEENVIEKYIGK